MRKLTLSKQKSMPRTDGNVLARLLTENNTCADCDTPLPGPTVWMDIRYGVFVCDQCAAAHRLLSDALVKASARSDIVQRPFVTVAGVCARA